MPVSSKGQEVAGAAPWLPWGELLRPATAQDAWRDWCSAAETWLISAAGISEARSGPYRGRGQGLKVINKPALPAPAHTQFGEVHKVSNLWAIRARRYRELLRARRTGRGFDAAGIARALARDTQAVGDAHWTARDLSAPTALPDQV